MNISATQINSLYLERKKNQEPFMKQMREIAELANGEVHVVHPELDVNEKATVVNLFPSGLDALATRAASVQPDQVWPPLKDGIQASEDKAWERRQAGLGWWDMNDVNLMDRLRFRHYFAWGSMPVTVLPVGSSNNDCRDIPHLRYRSPLTAYPAPCENKLDMVPSDAIFACRRSRKWLTDRYGNAMAMLNTGNANNARPDDMFDVLEYIDCDEIVLCCAGKSNNEGGGLWTPGGYVQAAACVVLERTVNKACQPLAVFPGRITLDRLQGALDQMLPAYHRAAKLDSLNLLAIARGIFPDQYIVGHPGDPQSPELVTDADGMMGIIGEVAHGQLVSLGNAPAAAQSAEMAIDRLERSQRLVAGLPAEINGESASNIRTARRGDQVLGSAIDMPIQEAQDVMQASKEAELRAGVAVMKGWYGKNGTSFYVPNRGFDPEQDKADYTPDKTFETDRVYVKYSLSGTDANSMVVAILQRVQGGIISQQTGREMDPAVEDPIEERDNIELEGIRRSLLQSIEQQAMQGTITPDQIALMAKIKWATHDQLEDVVIAVHKQAQQDQANQAQLPPGSPGTQPGLGGGAAPGQPQPGQVPGGAPSSPQLAQMLQTLAAPAKQGQTEAAQVQPPQQQPVLTGS
jgi:hypothetical protein